MHCCILFLFAINPYSYSIIRALTFHSNTQQTISWQKSSFRIYLSERWDLSTEDESMFDEDIEDFEDEEEEGIESTSIPIMGSKVRLRARVAYDGTGFGGWQFQNKGRTVQGELESVLYKRFRRHVRIIGAGRTDAGVHARGQAFHFDLYEKELFPQKSAVQEIQNNTSSLDKGELPYVSSEFLNQLQKTMNRMLPQDVRVWNLSQGPSFEATGSDNIVHRYSWHAMANAKAKLYSYRFSVQPGAITLDPLQRFSRVHIPEHVDVVYLKTLLKYFEGTHDFRAFAGAIAAYQRKVGATALEKNTFRTIYNITLVDESYLGSSLGNYRIDFILQGALFKMVRNIVGTVLDVAKGKMDESVLLQLLLQNSTNFKLADADSSEFSLVNEPLARKDNKCKPAAPEGLTLEHVFYDDHEF